jgi:iron(III) transport system ATP-binding protein
MLVQSPIGSFVAQRSVEWQPGMPALLFFRPEYVSLSETPDPNANGTNRGTATVERITFLGNSVDVLVRCGDVQLRACVHPARAPRGGKSVHFTVDPASCIVFPAVPS